MSEKSKKKKIFSPLSGKIKTSKFVGFDVETYTDENNTHTFYSGSLVFDDQVWYYSIEDHILECCKLQEKYKDKQIIFKGSKVDMQKDIISTIEFQKNCYIVATNLGFDFSILYWGSEFWNDFQLIYSGSKLILASISKNKRKVKLIDTLNFMPASVEALGNIIGIPKLEKPEFLGQKPSNFKERYELLEYNMYDSVISMKFLHFVQEVTNHLGGSLKLTVSSSALDLYRRKFMSKSMIKEDFYVKGSRDFIFEGYYGGRTEVFSRGKHENINYYDINSLYPSVMIDNEYPLPQSITKPKNPKLKWIQKFEGVSKVHVIAPKMKYPILPVKIKGKLCFPYGEFVGTYNHNELRYAISKGYQIIDVIDQIVYKKTFKPFHDYIEKLYDLRLKYKEQKSKYEKVVKLYMNSLYGKFAQHYVEDTKIINTSTMSNQEKKEFFNFLRSTDIDPNKFAIKDNNYIITSREDSNSNFSFPILASYTTSYARIKMHPYLENYDALYMDTDSIMTYQTLDHTSKKLGDMKLEGTFQNAILVKPKMYLLNNDEEFDVKIKGIPKPDHATFSSLMQGEGVSRTKFSKLKESIRRGFSPNTVFDMIKKLDLEDSKREWKKEFDPESNEDSDPIYYNYFDEIAKEQQKQRQKEMDIYSKLKMKYSKYTKSDKFDDYVVAGDISSDEFIENEINIELLEGLK